MNDQLDQELLKMWREYVCLQDRECTARLLTSLCTTLETACYTEEALYHYQQMIQGIKELMVALRFSRGYSQN